MATNYLSDPTTLMILFALLGFVVANMFSKGLLSVLLQVKVFKRGNVVVCCNHDLEDYYVVGSMDSNSLQFTTRKRSDNPKPKRILSFKDEEGNDTGGYRTVKHAIYRSFGVDCIMIDDIKNSIFVRDNQSYRSVGGYNAEAMAEKLDTALKKPPEDEVGLMPMKTYMILTLLLIVAVGIFCYVIYGQNKTLDAHQKLLYDAVMSNMNTTKV